MRKLKLLALVLACSAFALLSFLTPEALAVDLEVTCNVDGCSSVGDKPLFYETNILPDWGVTRIIKAINNYGEDRSFAIETVNFNNLGGLGDILTIAIKESGGSSNLYDDILTNLDTLGYKILSTVNTGGSQDYDFTVSLPSWVGNDYQGETLIFDLNLGFEMIPAPTATPTPTPGLPGAGPTPTPSGCLATIPTNAPTLSATAGVNTVALTWSAVSPVTHYAIRYGTSSGSYSFGAANVGNVTSYVVSGLSAGVTYYFQVVGVNDCAPGPWSNEAFATPTGVVLGVTGPAPGFEVLGEKTEAEEVLLGEVTPSPEAGKIAGAEVKRVCPWWWILLLLQAVIQTVYYCLIYKKEIRQWWIFPLAVSIIAFFAHETLHQGYLPSRFCPWFWLLDITVLAISSLFYFQIRSREQ